MSELQRQLLGESPEFLVALRTAELLAPTDATVLISGESGTGKELFAEHIHRQSRRARRPWVPVNCAALAEGLVEAELFGHAKGAFTGALERRIGRVGAADGGTLFLDEISELPLGLQPKLLRLLENGECQVVGEPHAKQVDVRIIVATNRNLPKMAREGHFRADLLYRLYVVPLELPPLRERTGDVLLLIQAFLSHFAKKNHRALPRISKPALSCLNRHRWSGNVRELRNLCERLSILHPGKTIESQDLPQEIRAGRESPFTKDDRLLTLPEEGIDLAHLEQSLLIQALNKTSGNKSRAAKLLGLSRDTFLYRLKKLPVPAA
ncbi:MAG: sigma-54 dependent transcriptional regulator [Gammaproteobacteria bacterium]|nr:sigma-54 dependent transcriptional regulator [Gammaproteobacteria bacterium]